MRVIAGEFGGRTISAPPGRATRPTGERVREALFSILGPLAGEAVLDLYAGSGALGIEALSRGAGHAVFVERERRAIAALRANLGVLGLLGERAEVRPADARGAVDDAAERGEVYDLVFLDPPYADVAEVAARIGDRLAAVLSAGARVVFESDRRTPPALGLALADQRRYGDTLISIFSAS